jgi:hypothetical protein
MDQKDSANNQSIVKTIMMGSRILAQGIYKGEAAKGLIVSGANRASPMVRCQ